MAWFRVIAIVLSASLIATGCATAEKTPLSAESKKKIKTVALISAQEPEKYFLNPGQAPGGFALYAFGAIGGLILGGIEATRAENATNEFTASVKPTNPELAQHWNSTLLAAMQAKGFEVAQLPPLPKKSDGKEPDCTSVAGKYDAVLLSTFGAGYSVESVVEPRVSAAVRLMSSNCAEKYFSDTYFYSAKPIGNLTHVARDIQFTFVSREALIADPQKAKEAMRTGLSEIVKKTSSEF
jgi:hypothetical protein